jgi:hypothetical protein
MAITNTGTDVNGVHSVQGTRYITKEMTVPADAEILLVALVWNNPAEDVIDVTWDGTTMTKIYATPQTGGSSDCAAEIWGILNPDPTTGNVSGDWGSTPVNPCAILYARCYKGIDTTNLATATNNIDTDEDLDGSNTISLASGGSSGNLLIGLCGGVGDDMIPATNSEGWTEIAEIESGGGAGNNQDCSLYLVETVAPDSLTVTFGAIDENCGLVIELVAATVAPTNDGMLMKMLHEGHLNG